MPIFKDLSNDRYHADPAISRSGIMIFNESPYKYWAKYLNPYKPEKKKTKAIELGSMVHTYVLEPHLFWEEYILEPVKNPLPEKVLLKNVGRPAYEAYKSEKAKIEFINQAIEDEFEVQSVNKKVISREDLEKVQAIREALEKHPEAWELIRGAIYEQSYIWNDKESGLAVKARPDILHKNIIVDLKTCSSASTRAYQRSMIDGGYHIQAAMIREGVKQLEERDIPNAINICVETEYPHAIGIKIIGEDALNAGQKQYKQALMQMKECFDLNKWPSYEIENVELPAWAI